MGVSLNFDSFANTLVSGIKMTPPQRVGMLVRVVGMTLEAKGLIAPVGSLCSVESQKHGDVYAEVIGFDDDVLYLMPFSEPVGVTQARMSDSLVRLRRPRLVMPN